MGETRQVEVEGRELRLTNLDKVLYPKTGFTKGEMVDYYAKVAPAIVPHLSGRAVTLRRFPEGVEDLDAAFFEKRCPKHRPKWVKTARVTVEKGKIDFCVCDSLPTLVWMAQLAAIELHPSLSLSRAPKRPTVLVFDLDPGPPADVVDCCRVGLRLRELLAQVELESFIKTSGSKGMQLYVPLNTKVTYEETRPFGQAIAQVVAKQTPETVLAKMGKKTDRSGKLLIDWYQNNERKTTISVYSLRARERPTVSTPVTWEEVEAAADSGDGSSLVFEPGEVLERIEQHGDLFAPVLKLKQELPNL
ncbi:MAG TPA: non-homologous end-joining DNA ligase [Solirubrobacterales bacterium]|nr:non-homologous end-joining DNA ligase [Solirubrobacterales bacterium]